MLRQQLIVCSFLLLLTSCSGKSKFVHDPSVPYPLLNPGDFWPDKFDQRGLQNAVIYRDRLYCNTIDVGGDANFLYCLNPKNGLVIWRVPVEAFATQPASFHADKIVYCSYLGDISTIDIEGKIIWKAQFQHPYGGHWVDTANARLLVKTVSWKNVAEYDIHTGKLNADTENDSLQALIDTKLNTAGPVEEHSYQFRWENKQYSIKGRPARQDEAGKYIIEITKS